MAVLLKYFYQLRIVRLLNECSQPSLKFFNGDAIFCSRQATIQMFELELTQLLLQALDLCNRGDYIL
jgi:hypothetical protein